jgi:hypothetical protein
VKLVETPAEFPTPPGVQEVADLLSHLVEKHAIARCVVIYEDSDGEIGWLNSSFDTIANSSASSSSASS